MTEKFGPLLRKWRNLSDLTQEGLVEELRIKLENERYGKSDICKWERGRRIPPEDIVEALEEILAPTKGLLLKATGFTSVAEEEQERGDKQQSESASLKLEQIEHISHLQQLAKSVTESFPIFYPTFDSPREIELFYEAYYSLEKLLDRLVHDAYWPSLAAHLNDRGRAIESIAAKISLNDVCMPWEEQTPVSNELKARVLTARSLIISGDLIVVAKFGDTKEWGRRGLKATCPLCPMKNQKTVDLSV